MYTVPLDAASRPDQGVVTEDGSGTPAGPGVAFPEVDARRSTTATGRAILADAAASVDRDLEGRIRAARSWRADYLGVLRELTIASAERTSSLAIARAGLASMRRHLGFERDARTVSLDDALEAFAPSLTLGTGEVRGAAAAVKALRVPYQGRELEGSALVAPARAVDRRRRDRAVIRRGRATASASTPSGCRCPIAR